MASPTSRPPALFRWLATRLVRGSETRYVLGDLDEAFERDVERGTSRGRASVRYLRNVVSSALSVSSERRKGGMRGEGVRERIDASRRRLALGISWLDVKLGFRMTLKHPGLTFVVLFALSIGIPMSLIPIHVMNVLSQTLPFDEGERIVGLRNWDVARSRSVQPSLHDFVVWSEELTLFDQLGAAQEFSANLVSEDGLGLPVRGSVVTASMFNIVRVPPAFGRTLSSADELVGAEPVVVLGYDVWRSHLGGDPEAVGKTLRIFGSPYTIVGIMPEGFLFPVRDHFWVPLSVGAQGPESQNPVLSFGRLGDGATMEAAQAELSTLSARMAVDFPETHARVRAEVVTFTDLTVPSEEGLGGALWLVQLLSLSLLTLACGSVGILVLARSATRLGEFAVRSALGASRARVVGQLVIETFLLAFLATGLGLLLLEWAAPRVEGALDSLGMPFWFDWGLNRRTVTTALFFGLFSAVVGGVLPALKATKGDVHRTILSSGAGGSGVRFGGWSGVLVVAMVTLAVCCLSIGAAISPGVLRDKGEAMGIDADDFLSAELSLPTLDRYRNQDRSIQQALKSRLEAEPGVLGVAFGRELPGMDHRTRIIEVEGDELAGESAGRVVFETFVYPGFFQGLGRDVVSGRDFDSGDFSDTRTAIIVNTAFVERVLGGRSPIGRRLRYVVPTNRQTEPSVWYEIVGVVDHLGMNKFNPEQDAGFYRPAAVGELFRVRLAVHLGPDPTAFTSRLREILVDIEPSAMIREPVALSEASYGEREFFFQMSVLLLGGLTGVAAFLGIAGSYALLSFSVERRTREIGIRRAVGAQPRNILLTISGRAFSQLGAGVVIGLLISGWILMAINNLPDSNLLPRGDFGSWPMFLGLVAGGVIMIGLLSCAVPTAKALRIRPSEALRADG